MVAEIKELQTEHAQIERMKRIFAAQKAAYRRQPYPTAEQRHEHIQQLKP
ncbi:MAG TPA: coniferyl-aldehyde dehydrogenase, partial [Alcanivorax sp.]|nr:coniferyl-aldehyde dehydrogenase [Alcanivorax sp.]